MEKIVLSGVYKNPEDMEYVLKTYNGKGVYTIESLTQMELLCSITKKLGLKIDVLIRVTSGNQFGLDKQDVRNIIENRKEYPWIHIQGLQFYSGTQKKMTQMQQELEELDVFIAELENEYGCKIDVLEYGPGFAVPYFMKDKDDELQDTLLQFKEAASNLQFKGKLTLEMGRYLAAYCGYFFTSVVDMKKNMEQNYAILDGGIHHLNYYGQTLAMKLPHCEHYRINGEKAEGEEELWNLCGSLCTVSDVIVKRFPLNSLKMNDILMFERTGAYSVTEGISLFLSRPLPKVYFWNEKDGLTLIRDGLHTDILNSEK